MKTDRVAAMHDMMTFAAMERRRIVQRIREEFLETPGLRLNVYEAARFWGLDEAICAWILSELAAEGFLAEGADQRFQTYREV